MRRRGKVGAPTLLPLFMKLMDYAAVAILLLVASASAADIRLADGRVLQEARIVNIGQETAMVMHKGGAEAVKLDLIDLEVLARAQMDLATKEAARKKAMAAAIAAQPEREAARKAEQEERAKLARAFAAADGSAPAPRAVMARGPSEQTWIALKQAFPAQGKGRYGKIEYDVPRAEIWSWHQGMVRVMTVESGPVALGKIEARLASDVAEMEGKANALRPSAEKESLRASAKWLRETLRPYLQRFREAR